MSLPHFFLETQVLADEEEAVFPLRLDADDLKHARVLRLSPGEHIAVIDAASDYFECSVVSFEAKGALMVSIAGHLQAPLRPKVYLVQGLAKGDKMDEIIRHATELGVCAFIPFSSSRSIVKLDQKRAAGRLKRWQAIAKSAAMQSGQPFVPEVLEPQNLHEVSSILSEATAVLVCWEEASADASIADALRLALKACLCPCVADARVAVVVGPEGGLTEEEVQVLLACNPRASLVSLGPCILRTETAGVVAPALVLYELER